MRVLAEVTGKTEQVYSETSYTANTWPRERRVIFKAEVVRADGKESKENPRFVITNLPQSPQWIYEEVYCQRGEIENRIKELHALEIDLEFYYSIRPHSSQTTLTPDQGYFNRLPEPMAA